MKKGKKKNNKDYRTYVVVARRCDRPMAEKKHLLPCEGGIKCHTCFACLEQDLNGEWQHCDPLR